MPHRRTSLTLGVLLGMLTVGGLVAANEGAVAVMYRAPADCPSQTEFEARVATQLGPATLTEYEKLVRELRVSIAAEDGGFVARLEVVDAEGGRAVRKVFAPTCEQAAGAIALVSALAVRAQVSRTDGAQKESDRRAAMRPANKAGASEATAVFPDESPPPVARSPEFEAEARAESVPAPALEPPVAPVSPIPPAVSPPSTAPLAMAERDWFPEQRIPLEVVTRAGGEFATGVGPGLVPGVFLGASLRFEVPASSTVSSLGLALFAHDSFRRDYEVAEARLRVLKGRAEFCPLEPSLSNSLSLRPCVAFELGSHSGQSFADGERVAAARSESRLWAAGVLGLDLGYRRGRWLGSLGTTLGLPLTRNRFVLSRPERELYEVPAVTFAVGVSLGLAL